MLIQSILHKLSKKTDSSENPLLNMEQAESLETSFVKDLMNFNSFANDDVLYEDMPKEVMKKDVAPIMTNLDIEELMYDIEDAISDIPNIYQINNVEPDVKPSLNDDEVINQTTKEENLEDAKLSVNFKEIELPIEDPKVKIDSYQNKDRLKTIDESIENHDKQSVEFKQNKQEQNIDLSKNTFAQVQPKTMHSNDEVQEFSDFYSQTETQSITDSKKTIEPQFLGAFKEDIKTTANSTIVPVSQETHDVEANNQVVRMQLNQKIISAQPIAEDLTNLISIAPLNIQTPSVKEIKKPSNMSEINQIIENIKPQGIVSADKFQQKHDQVAGQPQSQEAQILTKESYQVAPFAEALEEKVEITIELEDKPAVTIDGNIFKLQNKYATSTPQSQVKLSKETIEKLANQIKNLHQSNNKILQINLEPKDLGKIEIKLTLDGSDVSKIEITSNKFTTHIILQSGGEALRESLMNLGIKDPTLQFNMNDQNKNKNQPKNKKEDFLSLLEEEEFSIIV